MPHPSDAAATQPPDAPPKIVVICGPTGVGKTHLGIELALRFGGEVVNADSRYFYRGFDIGVAKPDILERRGVPHHLIDICAPADDMSLATYQELAMRAIAGVVSRGRLPLLVGGTPLYINAVVEGWQIPRVSPHPAIRARLEAELASDGLKPLADRLRAVDPVAAERSGRNPRRVIRALEIFEVTGCPMSELEGKGPRPYDALELGLSMPREALYAALDRRVDTQIERGLVDEVRGLLEGGVAPDAPAMSSIGYRQLLPSLSGDQSLADAVARIKLDTHRYVRHQETWLRRNQRLVSIDVMARDWVETATALVHAFLEPESGPHGQIARNTARMARQG
ncbi:MAG: tRNA (adenosine(37)-N6)-dimethylallyltransferase MiaA [Thermomicrobiales bacterium]|nr:tRNA (adenosine(37)-N6)-dimethylallyltransferase MiaA [Thermomicrobiales bacterium]